MSEGISLDTDLVRDRAAAALRTCVGDHKPVTRDMLIAETGFDARTVKAHVLAETTPTLVAFLSYAHVLGPTYASPIVALAGLSGLRRIEGVTTPSETLREIAEGAAALAGALADGRIDHTEAPKVVKELTEALVAISALLASLQRRSA
ncbi:MAG: hypothetical protein RBR34_05660 [Rhodospirillaceae bacterium]|nr:hypothetical protein [Rhodospirillaceae bacterium]